MYCVRGYGDIVVNDYAEKKITKMFLPILMGPR